MLPYPAPVDSTWHLRREKTALPQPPPPSCRSTKGAMDRFENTVAPPNGAVADSSLLSRRRKSRASRSYAARKNSLAVDPASPEVISSLISSLSTISVPLQSHFDNVPCVESAISLPLPVSSKLSSPPRTAGHTRLMSLVLERSMGYREPHKNRRVLTCTRTMQPLHLSFAWLGNRRPLRQKQHLTRLRRP